MKKEIKQSNKEIREDIFFQSTKRMFNAWEYPTDRFMKELTCGIFQNMTFEAGLKRLGNESQKVYEKKLNEIIEFANNENDYWWKCLENFCSTIDRKKIKRNIINKAKESLAKI